MTRNDALSKTQPSAAGAIRRPAWAWPGIRAISAVVASLALGLVSASAMAGQKPPQQKPPQQAGTQSGWGATVVTSDGSAVLTAADLERVWPRLEPRQQFIAVEQLLGAGQFEMVERLMRAAQYEQPGDRAIQRFYLGMAARGLGRGQEAVDTFRSILADRPELSRVRLELAATLFALKEDDSARHNFELVLGGAGGNSGLQNTVRSYINAIDTRKRWDLTTFLTIAPSTNINQGAGGGDVTINGLPFKLSDKNTKQSGVGVIGGFQAGYRLPVASNIDLVASGGAQVKRYKTDEFNDTLLNASLGPKVRFERGYLGLYGLIDHRWAADEDISTSFGGLLSASYGLTPVDLVFADLGCSQRRYEDNWRDTDMTYQSGHICYLSSRYDHTFDSFTFARALLNLSQERTGRKHLDNEALGLGAGVYREIPWGISLYLQALYTWTNFGGDYPGFDEARKDQRLDISVNLTKRDLVFFGMAPMVQYTFTHNQSSIPIHAYDAHGLAFTLTQRF